jgi:hypothetical protein
MQHFLYLEFARRLQVRAAAARFADDAAILVGEQTHRFCAARIYAEHMQSSENCSTVSASSR